MAVFPPVRTLIVAPSQVHSYGKSASLNAPKTNYPASLAVDGTTTTHARSQYGTDTLTVNLGAEYTPNIFGVFQHNVDRGLVCGFQATGSVGLDRAAAARRPHFWLDLRGFPPTASVFKLVVNGNSRPLVVGEIMIATGFVFHGSLQGPLNETIKFWQERQELEYGKIAISASGGLTRTGTLSMKVTAAELVNLEQVFDEAGGNGQRVIVVPDTRRNDIWFVEWPAIKEIRYDRTDQDDIGVEIPIVEESGGAV